jgi:hypothetical protein
MRFIDEYFVDFNGTQAAIRAGYSKKTANEQAAQILAKLNVKEEVERRKAELLEQTKLSALDYWKNLSEILKFDPSELFDENGIAKDMCDIPEHIRKSLKGYKVNSKIINKPTVDGKNEQQDAFSEVDFKYPDRLAAVKELGAALKISGDPPGVNFNFPVETLTDEEIDARIENGLKRIKAGKKP